MLPETGGAIAISITHLCNEARAEQEAGAGSDGGTNARHSSRGVQSAGRGEVELTNISVVCPVRVRALCSLGFGFVYLHLLTCTKNTKRTQNPPAA